MKKPKGWTRIKAGFRAQVFVKGKSIQLGVYPTGPEANKAYRDYRRKHPIGKSGIKKTNGLPTGVTMNCTGKRFIASIMIDGRNWHLGTCDTVAQAVKKRAAGEKSRRQWAKQKQHLAV